MKKLISVLMLLLLLGTLMFAEGTQEAASSSSDYLGDPPMLEMTKRDFYGQPGENEEDKQAWQDWASEYAGFPVKMNTLNKTEYMTKFQLGMTSGDLHGMGYIYGGSYYMTYANDGAILPIDEYIAANPAATKLDPVIFNSFTYDDQNWAVIQGASISGAFARSIRKDWLDNLGLEVPKTIEELRTVIKMFTENDPDGNGIDDTVGMTSAGYWNLDDIFKAYGVAMNHVTAHCIVPDPNDDMRYKDGMLDPAMEDCLGFLKEAFDNGWLDNELFTNGGSDMRSRMASGMYGSCCYWETYSRTWTTQVQKVFPEAEFVAPAAFTSEYISKNINPYAKSGGKAPWVLIAGTEEPGKVINAFVNLFMIDDIGYWAARMGVPGLHMTVDIDNKIVTRLQKPDEKYYSTPGMVSDMYPLRVIQDFTYALENEDPAKTAARSANYAKEAKFYSDGIADGLLWEVLQNQNEPTSETLVEISADIADAFEKAVVDAVTGQAPIKEAIAEYRNTMRTLGGQKVLDEGNAAIGKTTNPKYTY